MTGGMAIAPPPRTLVRLVTTRRRGRSALDHQQSAGPGQQQFLALRHPGALRADALQRRDPAQPLHAAHVLHHQRGAGPFAGTDRWRVGHGGLQRRLLRHPRRQHRRSFRRAPHALRPLPAQRPLQHAARLLNGLRQPALHFAALWLRAGPGAGAHLQGHPPVDPARKPGHGQRRRVCRLRRRPNARAAAQHQRHPAGPGRLAPGAAALRPDRHGRQPLVAAAAPVRQNRRRRRRACARSARRPAQGRPPAQPVADGPRRPGRGRLL